MKDGEIVQRLSSTLHDDWNSSRVLDLSDGGLVHDLESHSEEDDLPRLGLFGADSTTAND